MNNFYSYIIKRAIQRRSSDRPYNIETRPTPVAVAVILYVKRATNRVSIILRLPQNSQLRKLTQLVNDVKDEIK